MTARRALTAAPADGDIPARHEVPPDHRIDAIDILARTIWGEARGEPLKGQEAIAAVVLNRVEAARRRPNHWWGATVAEVCRKRHQFSCWNEDDPNRAKLMQVEPGDPIFATCLRIARRAHAGVLADPTRGATHYHARATEPFWAKGKAPTAEIGGHLFYRLDD